MLSAMLILFAVLLGTDVLLKERVEEELNPGAEMRASPPPDRRLRKNRQLIEPHRHGRRARGARALQLLRLPGPADPDDAARTPAPHRGELDRFPERRQS